MASLGRPSNKVRKQTLKSVKSIESIAERQLGYPGARERKWGEENMAIAKGHRKMLMEATDSDFEYRKNKAAREREWAKEPRSVLSKRPRTS